MFKNKDVVVITVKHPAGARSVKTEGRVGIVTAIVELDGITNYHVVWRYERRGFLFHENELRLATPEEITAELVAMLIKLRQD